MPDQNTSSWKRFWERGGGWKALLLAAVYYGLYELMGLIVGWVFGKPAEKGGLNGDATDVLVHVALPILLAILLLLIFAASLGWLRELFGPQPVRGRRWMWTAVVVVLAINVSSFLSVDYAEAGGALVAAWLVTGLCVGFAEELLTRGFVVNLMRKAGHGEVAVALVSAGIFAALHFGNVFTTDQGLATTLQQVVYTFGFGICMYLSLRVTGRLIWPILLHATTDPSLQLHGQDPSSNSVFGILSALSTILIVLTGLILLVALIVSERRRARA